MSSLRNVLCVDLLRSTTLIICVVMFVIITDAQGRPAQRVVRQVVDPRDSIVITGDVSNQLCPVVDCAESDVKLPCARDARVQTNFVVNGNTCPGCMGCPTTTVATTPESKQSNGNSPKGPNDA